MWAANITSLFLTANLIEVHIGSLSPPPSQVFDFVEIISLRRLLPRDVGGRETDPLLETWL